MEETPQTSPTGTPVLPPTVVPWLVAALSIAGALATTLPSHTIGAKVCVFIVSVGGPLLGVISPGMRKSV